jgi:uncharacterized ferritin-like protein (DUF455 family)
MQIEQFARAVVVGETLNAKLSPPTAELTDSIRGDGAAPTAPGRPPELTIQSGPRTKVPPLEGMADPAQRGRILHAFVNHELQAVELFAWALLAFPGTPAAFRRGLLGTLLDEQRHALLYIGRLQQFGLAFGELPVSGYFWSKLEQMSCPLGFLCAMSLTFENANLDHTLDYALAAESAGDPATAAVMREVHADEVRHVAFGLKWLARFKQPGESLVQAYEASLCWPLRPALARGPRLHLRPRQEAGFDADFVELLERPDPAAP